MPYLASKLTMEENVVYGLLALLAKTTSIDKGKAPPPKVINRKKAIQGGAFTFETLFFFFYK
jgi:hypothetical protein